MKERKLLFKIGLILGLIAIVADVICELLKN